MSPQGLGLPRQISMAKNVRRRGENHPIIDPQ
jgi:hypothetical protein